MSMKSTVHELSLRRGELLPDRLATKHTEIITSSETELPVNHKIRYGDWDIVLITSETGELAGASMNRLGQERRRFEPVGDSKWAFIGENPTYAETHFANLVSMVVHNTAEWIPLPPTNKS